MVYCTGMVCEALPGPVTVMVTFDVPAGVVYFTPLMAELQPKSVIDAPASRQNNAANSAVPLRRSRLRASPPSPTGMTGQPNASMGWVPLPPGRSAGDADETGATSDQKVTVTWMGCCQ
jgi:hypothetical protein